MKPGIKYKRKMKNTYYGIGRLPVQYHYVDLPCYMYFGYDSPNGIPTEKLLLMLLYKDYLKQKAPAYDVRSKYFDASISKQMQKRYVQDMKFENELRTLSGYVKIPDYKALDKAIKDKNNEIINDEDI